jgi:heat-inducible transcriptional repressor
MEVLNERRKRILHAVISEYVMTAEPVGSRTISKRDEIDLSPASIRNIMSDLEEMGYFIQPHTSSGRVPTDKAFRFYIEEIAQFHEVDAQTQRNLRQRTRPMESDVRSLVTESSRALSELSHYAGVGFMPATQLVRFRHIQFIRLNRRQMLIVFVTDANLIQNRIVTLDDEMKHVDLERMSNYLNSLLGGLTLSVCRQKLVDELASERAQCDAMLKHAAEVGKSIIADTEQQVVIEGGSNMLSAPEFGNLERMQVLLRAFEEKSLILRVFDKAMESPGVHIYMGSESAEQTLDNCALVTGTYGAGGKLLGAIGVIGPMRMDYAKVVPLVEYTSKLITRQLATLQTDE